VLNRSFGAGNLHILIGSAHTPLNAAYRNIIGNAIVRNHPGVIGVVRKPLIVGNRGKVIFNATHQEQRA